MPQMTLEQLRQALHDGTISFRDTRFKGDGDKSVLQNIRLPGLSITFERCLFETGLDLRGCRLDSLRFVDCIFAQFPGWNPGEEYALDLRNAVIDGLSLDIIPRETANPANLDRKHFQPCLSVNLDRAMIRQSAHFQVSTLFDGSPDWLGGKTPDALWGNPHPKPPANRRDAPTLVISAYQAKVWHDFGISVTRLADSENKLRGVAVLAPEIHVERRLTIIGSAGGDGAEVLTLFLSCNLELAHVEDQLRLSGVQLAFREEAATPDKPLPALSLAHARIGSLLLDSIALEDGDTPDILPVPDPARSKGSDPPGVSLPFLLDRFNITGQGVLANLRLDKAVIQLVAGQAAEGRRPDYPARTAELLEALARHDETLLGERALVTLHDALGAGGARSAPEMLKEHIQKNRRSRDFARHWKDSRKMLERAAAVIAIVALLAMPLTKDWAYGFVRGHLRGFLEEVPLYWLVLGAVAGLVLIFGLLRWTWTGSRTLEAIPPPALVAGGLLLVVAVILAWAAPHVGEWNWLNSFFVYLLAPVALLFAASRRGRHMIMQAVENLGQSWMTRIVSDGKRPLSVLSVLVIVWAGLSTMYFTAANRGFMAPEEIEAFHLEPWYAQTDALRLRLDDCAGGNCGSALPAVEKEAADATRIAGIYLRTAARDAKPEQNLPDPAPVTLTEDDFRMLARIPGFAYFTACRINWVAIRPEQEGAWANTVVDYAGIDWTLHPMDREAVVARVKGLAPGKVCAWYLPAEYSAFQPLLYAADVVIPLLNLRQEEEWSIRVLDPLTGDELIEAHVFLVFESLATLIGWLCVLILVSEVTGLSNPNRRFR